MNENDASILMNEAQGIDGIEAEHAQAAQEGRLDPAGQVIEVDPNARAMEWFLIPKTIAWAITALYPETAKCYSDAKCLELAHAIVPVADKYGITGIGDSPELSLIVAAAMFGAPAYIAHGQRKLAKEEAQADKGAPANGS